MSVASFPSSHDPLDVTVGVSVYVCHPSIGADSRGNAKQGSGIPGNSQDSPPGSPIAKQGLGIPRNSQEFPVPGIPRAIPSAPIPGSSNLSVAVSPRLQGERSRVCT